jgi:PAS domain-containing protein
MRQQLRVRGQQDFLLNEANFQALLETIPALAWRAKPDGHIDYVNRRLLEYFGSPLEKIIGWGWTDKVHPDDIAVKVQTGAVDLGTRVGGVGFLKNRHGPRKDRSQCRPHTRGARADAFAGLRKTARDIQRWERRVFFRPASTECSAAIRRSRAAFHLCPTSWLPCQRGQESRCGYLRTWVDFAARPPGARKAIARVTITWLCQWRMRFGVGPTAADCRS